jgi:hypothetical protein
MFDKAQRSRRSFVQKKLVNFMPGCFDSFFEFEIFVAAVTQPLPNVLQSVQIVAWQGSFPTLIIPLVPAAYSFQTLSNRATAIEIDNIGVFVVIQHDIGRVEDVMNQIK